MTVSWRTRCVLYGLRGDPELDQCATLLRGISALYGDGFDFSVAAVDDKNALHHVAQGFSLPVAEVPSPPTEQAPFMRVVGTSDVAVDEVLAVGVSQVASALRAVVERQLHGSDVIIGRSISAVATEHDAASNKDQPIKIFLSGDRSQVGKSTCCLGLVGSLLRLGYRADEISYIKPATQCEQPQLIAKFCRHYGIKCCDIGPIVFYSGFTREFLKGNTETSDELLHKARAKVEEIGRGKKIVVVDGVGYPAVGSICGVSNAAVAKAVKSPVVLVGKKGVGDAVDSFNLNACFFESQSVPVIGAIFNRLPLDGFYSLEKCRESVMQYFEQYQPDKRVYGFIPELPEPVARDGEDGDVAMIVDDSCCDSELDKPSEHMTREEMDRAKQVIMLFSQSVNVAQLVEDAKASQGSSDSASAVTMSGPSLAPLNKRPLSSIVSENSPVVSAVTKKSRQEIQAAAKTAGAAGG
jgi:dethiobiotin synthetase